MQKKVIFQSYNPYEIKFPNRKIISRETLLFIKLLRSRGIVVDIEPDDNRKLEYLTQKGFRQFLSDPVVIFLLGIPMGVFTNYVYDWIKETFNNKPVRDTIDFRTYS